MNNNSSLFVSIFQNQKSSTSSIPKTNLSFEYKKDYMNQSEINSDNFNNVDFEAHSNNPVFIFMFIVYFLSTFTAICSNLIVILVYLLGNKSNKTDISRFLFNLAIADFLMSTVCMPFSFAQVLLKRWIFGEIMCPLVLFKQVFSVSLSIYTMVVIGIDRYYAIKSPLRNRASNKSRNEKIAILLVWFISIGLGSVQLFVARMQELPNDLNETTNNLTTVHVKEYTCNEVWDSIERQQTYTLFNFFAVYLIPVFTLVYTYSCIACIIKSSSHPGNANASRDLNFTKSKKKVIKMLITLVCVFTLCWLPLHMFILIKDFTSWIDSMSHALWFYYTAHWLAMSDAYSIFCCKCNQRKEWKRQQTSIKANHRVVFKKLPINQNHSAIDKNNNKISRPYMTTNTNNSDNNNNTINWINLMSNTT